LSSEPVGVGESVAAGQELGACGNSGNSTQPHLHIQIMDSADASNRSTSRRYQSGAAALDAYLNCRPAPPGDGPSACTTGASTTDPIQPPRSSR
jgi:murein DD-endopeptidase MepM/ murein hydrolase activator NlpD